mmetsp:Transcript_56481/g.132480  ORF Transcript_56481/g.132480 Transcript_56481/m.132480 type:complete len:402 (+) Transcript_56481:84-1289(+)
MDLLCADQQREFRKGALLLPTEDPDLHAVEAGRGVRKWSEDSIDSCSSVATAGSAVVATKEQRTLTRRQVVGLACGCAGLALLCFFGTGTYHGLTTANLNGNQMLAFLWPASEPKVTEVQFAYEPLVTKVVSQLARAAFCSPTEEWSCAACKASGTELVPGAFRAIKSAGVMKKDSLFLYVAKLAHPQRLAGQCLVSFRGTRNFDNTLLDVEMSSEEVPGDWGCTGCHAHAGYLSALLDVEDELLEAMAEANCSKTEGTVVTGHSMGAALATLTSWLLQEKHNYKLSMVYAFESPRVVDVVFANAYDERVGRIAPTWRLTHYPDVVPFLPLQSAAFMHVQREVFFGGDSPDFTICNGVEDRRCMAGHLVPPWESSNDAHCQLPYVEDDGDKTRGNMCACSR